MKKEVCLFKNSSILFDTLSVITVLKYILLHFKYIVITFY